MSNPLLICEDCHKATPAYQLDCFQCQLAYYGFKLDEVKFATTHIKSYILVHPNFDFKAHWTGKAVIRCPECYPRDYPTDGVNEIECRNHLPKDMPFPEIVPKDWPHEIPNWGMWYYRGENVSCDVHDGCPCPFPQMVCICKECSGHHAAKPYLWDPNGDTDNVALPKWLCEVMKGPHAREHSGLIAQILVEPSDVRCNELMRTLKERLNQDSFAPASPPRHDSIHTAVFKPPTVSFKRSPRMSTRGTLRGARHINSQDIRRTGLIDELSKYYTPTSPRRRSYD